MLNRKKKILRCFKISGISTETNIHIIVFPKGEERHKGTENLQKDIIDENFPNLGKERASQVQEAQKFPNKINSKRSTIDITKMAKIEGKEY